MFGGPPSWISAQLWELFLIVWLLGGLSLLAVALMLLVSVGGEGLKIHRRKREDSIGSAVAVVWLIVYTASYFTSVEGYLGMLLLILVTGVFIRGVAPGFILGVVSLAKFLLSPLKR